MPAAEQCSMGHLTKSLSGLPTACDSVLKAGLPVKTLSGEEAKRQVAQGSEVHMHSISMRLMNPKDRLLKLQE